MEYSARTDKVTQVIVDLAMLPRVSFSHLYKLSRSASPAMAIYYALSYLQDFHDEKRVLVDFLILCDSFRELF